MRTLLAVLGLCGLLLMPLPDVADGGPSKPDKWAWPPGMGSPIRDARRPAASAFHGGQLTAAHRSLPLGTKVQVTNLRTKQYVVVKINDRGPYGGGKRRIIDLSEAAAQRVGLLEHGTERVEVVVVKNAS